MRTRWAALVIAVLLATASPAQAEVKKFLALCDGQACPYYELVLTPPDGWFVDGAAGKKTRIQMLLPQGKNFGNAEALIYVRVSTLDKGRPLAEFIKVSQERWRKAVPDAKISKIADVERKNGKAPFELYYYENPTQTQQAHEFAAFGIDSDNEGNDFVLQVVMTGRAKKEIDKADASYRALLRSH